MLANSEPQIDICSSTPFKEAFGLWLESRKPFISARTYKDYLYSRERLIAFFARTPLKDITPGQLRQYQQLRLRVCGGTSINHECGLVQQILRRVGVWMRIADDYQPLPLPRIGPGKSLSAEEETKWFAAAVLRPGWRVAYLASLISINTSAGPAELLNLRREHVRLEETPPEIQITEGTKNAYRIRHVPLNEKARWAAHQLLERAQALGATEPLHYLIPFRISKSSYDPSRHGTSWDTAHTEICATSGVKMRIYDFRHTCITRMLEAGVPEETVRAVCGHVSQQMTRRYSHIQMRSKLAAVQALGAEPKDALAMASKQDKRSYLRIMINCPVANKLVHTGMAADEKSFRSDASTYSSSFPCHECRQTHFWGKNDVLLLP
jgi:integrase